MLTIRKPIELKTQKPIQGFRQDMTERMQANYGLMNMSIRKEELLHVTSEPPEIYFAEGDNLQIFNNIKSQNQQELRLDVINNLINRIIVSQTENFTYQDTVYISSVLRRLGIRDEKNFMKQVFALQNEHKETQKLLQSYEVNQEILKQFFWEQKEKERSSGNTNEVVSERERRYYIHDEIFQRLETGKIYQDLRHFSKGNRHQSQQIFRNEINVGEQASQVQNFKLWDLRQKITNNPVPLYYCHNNQYEYLQEFSEEMVEQLGEQMSAAILLNVVDQSFSLRQQQIEENAHYWYSIAGALFQSAENTWKRYEANLLERKFVSNDMVQVLENVNEVKRLETTTIQNITDAYTKIEEQWKANAQIQKSFIQNTNQGNRIEEINISGGSYHLTQEELELQYLTQNEELEQEENSFTVEQLQKQLEVFNQQNYENYLKMEQIAKSQPQVKERKLDRKKAQKDALRALENPTEVLTEYLTTEIHDSSIEARKEMKMQIYELFSDETKEIYRQFLLQNHSSEETFLQYVMNQPEEDDVQAEVMQILESVQRQGILQPVRQERIENTEYVQPVVINRMNEEIHKQLQVLQSLQISKEYENWILPTEMVHETVWKEGDLLEEKMLEQQENMQHTMETILVDSNSSLPKEISKQLEKQILVHPEEITQTEEFYPKKDQKDVLHLQEKQLTDIHQNVERQLKHHQTDTNVLLMNENKETIFKTIDFVHKVEEQLVNEELLEEIRMQKQNTKWEEHTEQTTIDHQKTMHQTVQESVNHIQTNQFENVEELIQQSVKKQIGELSDQVYGKIEKKLQTERKRRGYF